MAAFLVWPVPTFVLVVVLLPAAALLFPILESGRFRENVVWRVFAGYSGFVSVVAIAATFAAFPGLFPLLLLSPFFTALLVLAREALPSP